MTAPLAIRLHAADNVVVARMDILPGTDIEPGVTAIQRVPQGASVVSTSRSASPSRPAKYSPAAALASFQEPSAGRVA